MEFAQLCMVEETVKAEVELRIWMPFSFSTFQYMYL
jgi:hypothetical protein